MSCGFGIEIATGQRNRGRWLLFQSQIYHVLIIAKAIVFPSVGKEKWTILDVRCLNSIVKYYAEQAISYESIYLSFWILDS